MQSLFSDYNSDMKPKYFPKPVSIIIEISIKL